MIEMIGEICDEWKFHEKSNKDNAPIYRIERLPFAVNNTGVFHIIHPLCKDSRISSRDFFVPLLTL